MNTEQKAAAYDNLLKAIEDKRLAVVPKLDSLPDEFKGSGLLKQIEKIPMHSLLLDYLCWLEHQRAAISAVDQQEILKELEA